MSFAFLRYILFLFVIDLVFFFQLPLYIKTKIIWANRKQRAIGISAILVNCILIAGISCVFIDNNWENTPWKANLQNNYVAESMLDGHAFFSIDSREVLNTLENPYDYSARMALLKETGEEIIMDLVYFYGKYYSYFGVVPVIQFYIPYLLITGHWFYTAWVIVL